MEARMSCLELRVIQNKDVSCPLETSVSIWIRYERSESKGSERSSEISRGRKRLDITWPIVYGWLCNMWRIGRKSERDD